MYFNQKVLFTSFVFFIFILMSVPIYSQLDGVKDTSNFPIKIPVFSDNILVDLWAQNSSYIYNLNSGYVGIGTGTNTPASRLTVWGSGWNAGGLEINNGSGFLSRISSASDGLLIRNFSSSSTSFSFRNSLDLKLLTIKSNGFVGIGTINPLSTLDILGGLAIGSYAGVNAAPSNGMIVSGNVGIGVTNPLAKLQIVQGTNTAGLRIQGSPTYSADIMLTDGVATAHIKQTSTGKLVLETDGGDIILNASVGIGTLTPNTSYKLDVVGRVRANEVVVNTTGADFVFQENYNLRSLTEVETFIKENKHLPEIPNAEEMQQNGMSLSEMNTKLLQKVEELTLYLIDLKGENESLKTRVDCLEAKSKN